MYYQCNQHNQALCNIQKIYFHIMFSRIFKSMIATSISYHGYHYLLPVSKKHNLVLDLDHTIGYSAFEEVPDESSLQSTVREFGNTYSHMTFVDIHPETKVSEVSHYFFFPRRHLWLIGFLQQIGYLNVHFYSDAQSDYVEHIMDLCKQCGLPPTFPFVSREINPDYPKKKDLHVTKNVVYQHQGIELEGSMTLVDDKKSRHVEGQGFYHIPAIKNHKNDHELLKMLFSVYVDCVVYDLKLIQKVIMS